MIRRINYGRGGAPLGLRAGSGAPSGARRGDSVAAREPVAPEQLRSVLEVVPGERRLLPAFGCGVHRLDDPALPAARPLAAALVEEAIERWLPAVRLERADVVGGDDGVIRLALTCDGDVIELEIRHRRDVAIALGAQGLSPGLAGGAEGVK